MSGHQLKFWACSSPVKSWDRICIAAYTLDDAVQLYVDAGGGSRGARSQLTTYGGGWGIQAHVRVPNPSRGCYLMDRHATSVMFLEPKGRSLVEAAPAEAQAAAAAAPVPEDYGKLRVGFSRGVRIDVWKYESPHHDRAHADLLTAEVRMRNADRARRQYGNSGDAGMEFVATSKCWEGNLSSPNINKLFEEVQAAFRTFDLAQRGIVWEDWLEVEIAPQHEWNSRDDDGGNSNGLTLSYRTIKRGVDPRNESVYTIHEHGGAVLPFPRPKAAGEKDRHPKTGKVAKERGDLDGGYFHEREQDHQYAYLPATPETRAALDLIILKLVELRSRLAGLLEQKVIASELNTVTQRLLEFKQ